MEDLVARTRRAPGARSNSGYRRLDRRRGCRDADERPAGSFLEHLKGSVEPFRGSGRRWRGAAATCCISTLRKRWRWQRMTAGWRLSPAFAVAVPRWCAPLTEMLGRVLPPAVRGEEPAVDLPLDVDREYCHRAAAIELPEIAPTRFNPRGRCRSCTPFGAAGTSPRSIPILPAPISLGAPATGRHLFTQGQAAGGAAHLSHRNARGARWESDRTWTRGGVPGGSRRSPRRAPIDAGDRHNPHQAKEKRREGLHPPDRRRPLRVEQPAAATSVTARTPDAARASRCAPRGVASERPSQALRRAPGTWSRHRRRPGARRPAPAGRHGRRIR
jgi:hypothetical protein